MNLTGIADRIRKAITKLSEIRYDKSIEGRTWTNQEMIDHIKPIVEDLDNLMIAVVEMDARRSYKPTDNGIKLLDKEPEK